MASTATESKPRLSKRVGSGAHLVSVLVLGGLFALCARERSGQTILYEKDSAYNHIVVTEEEPGLRSLRFERGGGLQSVVKLGDADYLELGYVKTMLVGLAFVEEPRRMLVVGLGGGTIPSFLHKHYPRAVIDVVDIDPDVVAVARKYFGFREDKLLKTHVEDGRRFIERGTGLYDLVFLDAYGNDFIPPHLTTREFLLAARKILRPGGAVVGNVWSLSSNPLHDSMLRTYQDVFSELYRFNVRGKGNKIFVGQARAGKVSRENLAAKARGISRSGSFRFDLGSEVEYGYQYVTTRAIRAPVLKDKSVDAEPERPAKVR